MLPKNRLLSEGFNNTLTALTDGPGRRGNDQIKEMRPILHLDLREPLSILCNDPMTTVVVPSGCASSVLDENFKDFNLWLAAENGMFLRPTKGEWMTTMPEHLNIDWFESVQLVFYYFSDRTPRSYVEERTTSLVWNYKFAEEDSLTRNLDSISTVSSTRISPHVYISCLGTFVTGYNFGIVNVSLEFILKHLQLEKNTLLPGKILGSIIIAAAVGSCFSHLLVEKYGRKRILQLSAVPFLVGSLLSATAKNLMLVIMGQLSVGIGVGIVSATVPLYISEITPIELHGASGTVNQLLLWLGVLVGLLMGLPLNGNPEWWRIMFLATIFPTVGMVAGIINSPESPFWLIQQGNIPETEKAIEILWGKERVEEVLNTLTAIASANNGEPLVSWQVFSVTNALNSINALTKEGALQNALAEQKKRFVKVIYYLPTVFQKSASDLQEYFKNVITSLVKKSGSIEIILDSFSKRLENFIEMISGKQRIKNTVDEVAIPESNAEKTSDDSDEMSAEEVTSVEPNWFQFLPKHFDKVGIGAALILFQQLVSVNAVIFYMVNVVWIARMPFSIASSSFLVVSLIIGTAVAYILMNRISRKNLLVASYSGMAASAFLMLVSISELLDTSFSFIAVLATSLYLATFAMGAGAVPFVHIPELLPIELRAKGLSYLTGLHWISLSVVGYMVSRWIDKTGLIIFVVLFALCVGAVKFIQKFFIEEIDNGPMMVMEASVSDPGVLDQ